MTVIEPTPANATDGEAWDANVLAAQPHTHYMQSSAWAETREGTAWTPRRDVVPTADGELPIQLFERKAPLVGSLYFIPRVSGLTVETVQAITERAKSYPKNVFGVKLETFQDEDPELVAAFKRAGWVPATSSQYQFSVMIDLSGTIDEVAARFKKRARNSYRAAIKHGVTVEKVEMTPENEELTHKLINEVRLRTGGYFRQKSYVQNIWDVYKRHGQGYFYITRYEGEVQSSAFVIRFGDSAWYKDAGSIRENSKIFAPYLMQWEIIQDLHSQGVQRYELANIPDPATWETSDIRGLYTFKTAWSKDTKQYMPTFELPLQRSFKIWQRWGRWLRAVYTRRTGDAWY